MRMTENHAQAVRSVLLGVAMTITFLLGSWIAHNDDRARTSSYHRQLTYFTNQYTLAEQDAANTALNTHRYCWAEINRTQPGGYETICGGVQK